MSHSISNKQPPARRSSTLLIALAVIVGLLYIFADLSEDVWFREIFSWDSPLALFIHSLSRPWLDVVMRLITETGSTGAILVALAVAGWFIWKRQRNKAILLLFSFGGAVSLNALLKLVFARTRPTFFTPLMLETDFSFPSGHSVAATVLYGMLAVLSMATTASSLGAGIGRLGVAGWHQPHLSRCPLSQRCVGIDYHWDLVAHADLCLV